MAEEGDGSKLTYNVIGAAIEVHRALGPGLLEAAYQRCMERELSLRGIPFQAQAQLPVVYKGVEVGEAFVIDLYFPGELVVELKAVDRLQPIHEAQLLSYMRLSRTRVGLLINFNVAVLSEGIKRMAN